MTVKTSRSLRFGWASRLPMALPLALVLGQLLFSAQALAANLGAQTSACLGSACPVSYPAVNACGALGANGYDEGYAIVTGGNMDISQGSEAEGRMYIGGSLSIAPSRFYNLIAVGAGSCVVPRNSSVTGQPGLVVGGGISVGSGSTFALDGLGLVTNALVGGTKSGTGQVTSLGAINYGALVPASPVDFASLRSNSAYWASLPANGSTVNQFGTLTFTGSGSASLQVFTLSAGVSGVAIDFQSIPANATVLINVTAAGTVSINSNAFFENLGSFSTSLTRRIVWNFANASQVNLTGTAQFKGSVVVPNGSLMQAVPGTNGRLIVSGDLTQNSAGSEFHSYDFTGDLPNPPSPASLVFTKAYTNNPSPSKISSQPAITVRAVCSAAGTRTVTFTPPATGTIAGLSSGESCTLSETALSGGSLSGGYKFSVLSAASFSGSNPRVLSAGSNAVTVSNPLIAPTPAVLSLTKSYSNNSPNRVSTQPSITVQAVCSVSGTRTTSFTAGSTGTISGLIVGETCTVTETAITGGSLSGGYSFGSPAAAVISLNAATPLTANTAVSIANPLVAPTPAVLSLSKSFSNNSPNRVSTQPTINVQAVCSVSGTKTTSFTAGTTGTLSGLIVGETCTVTETAISGGTLSGGYSFAAPSAAVISLGTSTPLVANTAVSITNPLVAPAPAALRLTKAYSGDTSPSRVTAQPTIGVRAVCSVSGSKTTSFTAGSTGSITGLVVGETCTVTETSVSGGSLSGGYTFSSPSAATISLSPSTPLVASTAVTITNPLVAPGSALLSISKAFSNDTSPSKVSTLPSISVQAICSISGSKSTSFNAGTIGTIAGLVQGETCTVTETAISGGALSGGYAFAAPAAATISLGAATPLTATTSVLITNPLVAPTPARLNLTKAFSNDTAPSKVTSQPSITVQAVCSVSGVKSTSFTAGTTGSITGLIVGETCTVTETAISGGTLAGGYAFASPAAASVSLNAATPLVANTAVVITNPLLVPTPAQLSFVKRYTNDTAPSKVTAPPTISVQAICSVSGVKSTSFTADSTGSITGLIVGETCTVTETGISGGTLAGGYRFASPTAAAVSLSAATPLTASTAVTITNPLVAPEPAVLNFSKVFTGDTVPSKVSTPPTISVQAQCSVSGLKSTSFLADGTGSISGLIVGETCTVTETAISGGALSGGYGFAAPTAAAVSLAPTTALSASNAVTISNPLLAPGAAVLSISKRYANDASPSLVSTPPTISVQAQCSVSGVKTLSFNAGSVGTLAGLVVGETCALSETGLSGGVLTGGYSFGPLAQALISLGANTALSANTAVTITNPLLAPSPAQLSITKAFSNDTVPSKVSAPPTITVQAQCTISGTRSTSFTAGTTGVIAGLVVGETCALSETAVSGGALSGGYRFQAPAAAQISLSSSSPLTANTAVVVTNPLLPPPAPASLRLSKLFANDSSPSAVLVPPDISVMAQCSASGSRSVRFRAGSVGEINDLLAGETCVLSETAISGGSLREGYRFAPSSAALISLGANSVLTGLTPVTITNQLLPPGGAVLNLSKSYANDTVPSRVLQQPSIFVQAQCSSSGLKTTSFTAGSIGTISGLLEGEICTVSETAVSGGTLADGYSFAPVQTAQVSLAAGTPLTASTDVNITNLLQAPAAAELRFTKRWLNDASPSRVTLAPTITVRAQCAITGLHSLSFPSSSVGRMTGLVVGETCQLSETAVEGGALAGGYAFEPPASAQFSLAPNEALSALNEVSLSNPLLPPGAAALNISKRWANDALPSLVLTPPMITVQALCSVSGLKSVTFSAAETARLGGLVLGETCALSETRLEGGSLPPGYSFAPVSAAAVSLLASTPLQANTQVTLTNPLQAPKPARILISKRFDGNAAALTQMPQISVQAACSVSGLKTVSFTPPALGAIEDLSSGETCLLTETAATGAVLSGGHVLAPVSSALITPAASVTVQTGDNAVLISNAVLMPQVLTVAKAYQGDTARLLVQPQITVQAQCSSSGLQSITFRPPATGSIGGLAIGESCELSETLVSGAQLSGGFVLAAANTAQFSPSARLQIVAGSNNATVINRITPPDPQVDLIVRKSHGAGVLTEGRVATYTVVVSNRGAAATTAPYSIVDTLPAGLTVAALPAGQGWDCSATVLGSNLASCTSSTQIAAAGTKPVDNPNPIRLQVVVAKAEGSAAALSCAVAPRTLTNVVTVSGGGEGSDPAVTGNNRYEDVASVQPLSSISGEVWLDVNHDRQKNAGEGGKGGVLVEVLDSLGNLAGSGLSDPQGQYRIDGLAPGEGYSVRFKDPASGAYFGRPVSRDPAGGNDPSATPGVGVVAGGTIQNVTVPACGPGRLQQSLPLDPAGVAYCSSTRAPMAGVKVELLDKAGGLVPAACMVGGVNSVTTQIGMNGVVDGGYSLFLVNPPPPDCPGAGDYRLRVTAADGSGPSSMIPPRPGSLLAPANCSNGAAASSSGVCTVQDQAGPPALDQPTPYYLQLKLDPARGPDVVNNHIALDACSAPQLFVAKTVDRQVAEVGESVRYAVTVKRADAGTEPLIDAQVIDKLPAGFKYIPGTAQADGRAIADPLQFGGSEMHFKLGNLQAKALVRLSYRVRIGVGSQQGTGINRVQACVGGAKSFCSNEAQAKVKVSGGVFSQEACVIGKVYLDCNHNQMQDDEEIGIPGVRLYMEDGSYSVTDVEGKYSRCGLSPHTHVLVTDSSTLPRGSRLVTSSNRNAGDAASLFLDLRHGDLQRADFIEGSCAPGVVAEVQRRRNQGETGLPLRTPAAAALALRFDPGIETPTVPASNAAPVALAAPTDLTEATQAPLATLCMPRRAPVLAMPPPERPRPKLKPPVKAAAVATSKPDVPPRAAPPKKALPKASARLPMPPMPPLPPMAPSLPECAE
ncbi:DUF5979 domain-containing protein [Roseateles albus]|uniref:DUF5979 domain-containing protein n=1 Tax=Roseateles albus TaxID=2987525 RepID=A0ABT5KFX6_9BURK|nr:DUF5979 domain-containing protein [Roseateles albus]MDC8772822.1 DUF5979 domain-containing protein [Roseateles albus]